MAFHTGLSCHLPSTKGELVFTGREFTGRTDNYTLNLYWDKGYVLDKRFLDQGMCNVQVNHIHGDPKALIKPCVTVIKTPEPPDTTPAAGPGGWLRLFSGYWMTGIIIK